MAVLDPRLAIIAGVGGAVLGSHRVRTILGRGAGYTAKGVMTVVGPVARPMVHAGEEIVDEARHTAGGNGAASKSRARAKAGA
ncbi:MAG: hypothetical protein ACXVFN_18750 [Solirubrobacteraceae bacterium]